MSDTPTSIPLIAPSLLMRLENIPNSIAGKKEDAASPNAKATVAATKPLYQDLSISCAKSADLYDQMLIFLFSL